MTYIYALRDETGIRYVGKADDVKRRANAHWQRRSDTISHKNSWLKSLDARPEVQILQEVEDSEWPFAERDWILQLKSIGCKLTNMTDGGEQPPVRSGEDNNFTKLSDVQVLEIRERIAAGELGRDLAVEFDVRASNISAIVRGQTRKEVGGPMRTGKVSVSRETGNRISKAKKGIPAHPNSVAAVRRPKPHLSGENHPGTALTESNVRAIRANISRETHGVLAKRYGVSRPTVTAIISRRNWSYLP